MVDIIAKAGDLVGIEVTPEVGFPGHVKLYVHVNGETVLRICKLKSEQPYPEGLSTFIGKED